jgi:hypothetical protein
MRMIKKSLSKIFIKMRKLASPCIFDVVLRKRRLFDYLGDEKYDCDLCMLDKYTGMKTEVTNGITLGERKNIEKGQKF